MIDISNVQRNNRTYNGNSEKYGITVNGIDYIVKFPKKDDMSVYCEYIASNLIRSLGVSCHEVSLATCNNRVVNVIKDFTSGTSYDLHSFVDTKQSSEDTDIGNKDYTYVDVLYLIDKHLKMTESNRIKAKEQFWLMFICDTIIGNRDRHWGNWGYLNTPQGYIFAPLYDNGGGLFPDVNKVIQQYINVDTRKKFIYERIFVFPASLFKIKKPDCNYRSNYADMYKDLRVNKIFAQQVNWLRNSVTDQKVFNTMKKICMHITLPVEYRRFYIEIVTLRYMCIIRRIDFDVAYKHIEGALKDYV